MKKIFFSMGLLSVYTTVACGMKRDPEITSPPSSFVQKETPKRSALDAQDPSLGTSLENTPDTSDNTELTSINSPQKDENLQDKLSKEKDKNMSTPTNTLCDRPTFFTFLSPIDPSFPDSYEKEPFLGNILSFPQENNSNLSCVHETLQGNHSSTLTAPLENPIPRPLCKNFERELEDLKENHAQIKKQWEEDLEKLRGLRSQQNTLKEEKFSLTKAKEEKKIVALKEKNTLLEELLSLGKKLHILLSRITSLQDTQILFLQANQPIDGSTTDERNAGTITQLKRIYGHQLNEYHHLTSKLNAFLRNFRQWRREYQQKKDNLTRSIKELDQQEEYLISQMDTFLNKINTTHRRITELEIYITSQPKKQM